jgi:hypothetical protein
MTKIKGNSIVNRQPATSSCSMSACDLMQYVDVSLLESVSLFCLVIFGLFKLTKS